MNLPGTTVSIERSLQRGKSWTGNTSLILLMAAAVLYAAFFSIYQFRLHGAFSTGLDTLTIEQPLWNTLQGRFMGASYYPVNGDIVTDFNNRQTTSLFGDHFQPSLLLLLPFYALVPRTETLLAIFAILTACGIFPAYRIALRRTHSPKVSLLLGCLYLLLPAIQVGLSGDIHAATLLPTFILAAYNAFEEKKTGLFWVFLLVAMGLREDIPFMLAWAYLWITPRDRRREILPLVISGMLWSLFAFVWIIPHFSGGGGSPYLARYLPLGTEISIRGIWGVMSHGWYWKTTLINFILYNIRLGLPFLFLYFLSPRFFVASLPIILMNGFSWYAFTQFPDQSHYSAPILPWLWTAALDGLLLLASKLAVKKPAFQWKGVLFTAYVTALITVSWMKGYLPLERSFHWPEIGGREVAMRNYLESIPPEAAVSAEVNLAPHLSQREVVRIFPDTRGVDIIVLDLRDGDYPFYWDVEGIQVFIDQILASDEWTQTASESGIVILTKDR